MTMLFTCTDISSRIDFIRSCVIGRGVTTPWSARAIDAASGWPIQIGRYRSPSDSRRSTIGWFEGSSIRTPARFISTIIRRSSLDPPLGPGNLGAGQRLGQVREEQVRVLAERRHVLHRKDIGDVSVPFL